MKEDIKSLKDKDIRKLLKEMSKGDLSTFQKLYDKNSKSLEDIKTHINMKTQIEKITSYDLEFNETFAIDCLELAIFKANSLKKRIYLMHEGGCIYYVTEEDMLRPTDMITFVDPT